MHIKSNIKKIFFLIILIICSCSKENINELETVNHDLDYNLAWHSGTSYDTTIQVGQTITWTWGGGTHNLVSTGGVETFDSGYSSAYGFSFSHTFTVVGTTNYVCDPHESHMYGTVTVIE